MGKKEARGTMRDPRELPKAHLHLEGSARSSTARELPNYERSETFSPLEKLVLRYAVVLTKPPTVVPDDLFGALRGHFGEAQMVELTAAIALENYRARFNHAFGVRSQGFSEGSFCAMPETLTMMKGVE